MSSAIGVMLLSASLGASLTGADRSALPRPVLEAGLKKAQCSIAPRRARVVGTEMLSHYLRIVEVGCWQAGANDGSILFAVPVDQPQLSQLITVDRWDNGKVVHGYSVASPGYEAKTRTLSTTFKASASGDCGTIQEMKWTGWHFELLNVWRKDTCDGVPFEWDSRERWQVFPRQAAQPDTPAGPPIRQQAGR